MADPPLPASNEGLPSILLPVADGTDAQRRQEFLSWFAYTSGEKSFEATLPRSKEA